MGSSITWDGYSLLRKTHCSRTLRNSIKSTLKYRLAQLSLIIVYPHLVTVFIFDDPIGYSPLSCLRVPDFTL